MVSRVFQQGYPVFSFGRIFQSPQIQRRFVSFLLILLSLALYSLVYSIFTSHFHQNASIESKVLAAPTATVPATVSAAKTLAAAAPTPAPKQAPQAQAVTAAPKPKVTQKSCTPVPGLSISPLSLTDRPAGLTEVVDPVRTYQLYGETSSDVHKQVQKCAPGAFIGDTTYSLTSQYDVMALNGSCTITNAKVGVRISMTLPALQTSNATYSAKWQSFTSNLTTHENGHVQLDHQFAAQLLASLQSYPPGECGSVKAGLRTLTAANTAALQAANEAYDARTNHGATQGAILP